MKIKVLVVEDKQSLNKSIVNMLKKEKFSAYSAFDMDKARDYFFQERPHIILLDIMLPGGNGYDLIPFFCKHHDSRILMLSALDDRESKRICYEYGADDYISKPFDMYELQYKLNAIRRRIILTLEEYKLGDISFNTDTNELSCKDKSILIQPSQTRFLKLIYEKYLENGFLDKSEVFEDDGDNIDDTGRLQTLVARLRKNLSYIGSEEVDIETVYGKGYKIVVLEDDDKRRKA